MKFFTSVLAISVVLYHALGWSDHMIYDIQNQPKCTEVTRGPTGDCRWAGLNVMADQVVEGGRIIAYKIQWFNGGWSGWYAPGYNDIDWKFNLYNSDVSCPPFTIKRNSLRKVWSYFQDHTHMFVVCKP